MIEIAEQGPIPAPQTARAQRWERGRRHWVRARTLIHLRWGAIAGQVVAVLLAEFALGFDLPLLACFAAILAGVWFNVAAAALSPQNRRLREDVALSWLLFDALQFSVLLGLTGGLSNPFSLMMLTPVAVAAATLTPRSIWIAIGISVAAIVLLAFAHMPLRLHGGEAFVLPRFYQVGVAAALASGLGAVSFYVWRVANEGFRMSEALSATQLALSREQRFAALGAMAAAAAHELGTPLATIALTAKEIERELTDRPDLAEDMALIREQTARCRDILAQFARQNQTEDEQLRRAPFSALIEEAAAPLQGFEKRIVLAVDAAETRNGPIPLPVIPRRPEIIHGLRNLIQNAVDFASGTVWIDIRLTEAQVRVTIEDDGPGLSPEVLSTLGEPFVTTRGRGDKRAEREPGGAQLSKEYVGMGLGVFIAKTLLERSGAVVAFGNGDRASGARASGAVASIAWRRRDLEALRAD